MTTTDKPYTPDEGTVRAAYALHANGHDLGDSHDEFDRFLARVRAEAAAQALRDAVESNAITIPDMLGYKVHAVAAEDLLNRADRLEQEGN